MNNSTKTYQFRRAPSIANLTTPNSPFTSRPSSRHASKDEDRDDDFSNSNETDNNNLDNNLDVCDTEDGTILFSSREVEEAFVKKLKI